MAGTLTFTYTVQTNLGFGSVAADTLSFTYNAGIAGEGVPAGGTTGQALVKTSNADYDTEWASTAGLGTVTSVSVTTANGVSGAVANATTTPAITLTLGAITPTSVNGVTLSGSGSLANSGTTSVSGTNTGDQTLANTSDATSHTLTLSGSGGSIQFVEGSNITLTTSGTSGAGVVTIAASGGGGGSGDVVGPASATDNAVVRFDTTTGKLIQNSVVTIADTTGNVAGVGTLNTHTIPGGTTTFVMLGTAQTFTALNKFTGGLESYLTNDNGVVLGPSAGAATPASDAVRIGFFANGSATTSSASGVFVGRHAGSHGVGDNTVMAGHAAGQYAYSSANSVIIGAYAARNPTQNASHVSFLSVIIGTNAAASGLSNQTSTIVGAGAGQTSTAAVGSVLVGYNAGNAATATTNAVIIGNEAGTNSTSAANSVLIGNRAGYSLVRNSSLVIESNPTYSDAGNTGLIYGEFDNRVLRFNAATTVKGAANNTNLLSVSRFTDTSPTGTFLRLRNAADTTTLFGVDIDGNLTSGTVNGVTFSGSGSVANSGTSSLTGFTGSGSSSGTNTGDQTSVTGNAGTATALQTGRTIAITGDLAYTSPSFDGTGNVTAAGTLATVNANVGSFGSATQSVAVTVNAKGLVTAASASTITPAVGSITGLGTGVATFLATPSSANLATAVTDETGSGALVFATSPTLVTPALGTPSSGTLTNCTGLPTAGIVDSAVTPAKLSTAAKTRTITVTIGDGTNVPTVNTQTWVSVPFACTITKATLLADASGSAVIGIWKDTYANYPPVVGDSITASAPPTISSAIKSEDSTLTGWTTSVTAGDILLFNLNSVTTCKRLVLSIEVTQT